jgi:hypothetical protein
MLRLSKEKHQRRFWSARAPLAAMIDQAHYYRRLTLLLGF